MLADFARRAEIVPGATAEETGAALKTYFDKYPIDPGLIREFKRTTRAELLTKDPGVLARSATRWLAADPKRLVAPDPATQNVIGRGRRKKPK